MSLPGSTTFTIFDAGTDDVRDALGEDCDDAGVNSPCFDDDNQCDWYWLLGNSESLGVIGNNFNNFASTFVITEGDDFTVSSTIEQYRIGAGNCSTIQDSPFDQSASYNYSQINGSQDFDFVGMGGVAPSTTNVAVKYRVQSVQN